MLTALFIGLGSIGTRHLKNLTALCAQRGLALRADALRSDLARPLRPGAAELLHEDGIEARVVKLNRISPFRGGELSRIFGTTKRLLVAEECSGVGCIGQRIAAILAEEGHEPQRLMLCNLGRRFIEQGSVGELYRQCGLDAESLARTAKEVCQ